MQLIINNKLYTDNSQEADENSVFVVSKQNEKFKQNAIDNGCKNIIDSSELKNHIDLSSIRIDILDENIEKINSIINITKSGTKLEGSDYTNGNINREV